MKQRTNTKIKQRNDTIMKQRTVTKMKKRTDKKLSKEAKLEEQYLCSFGSKYKTNIWVHQ